MRFHFFIKGTVSELPLTEWHVKFTAILFKPLLDQGFRRYLSIYSGKLSAKTVRVYTSM